MPELPRMSINDQVIYDRVMSAFDNDPVIYRKWLRRGLRQHVISVETGAIRSAAEAQEQAKIQELIELLPEGNGGA